MKRLVSKEISDDKVYHFLDDIRTIQYKNSILVVCVPTGNWIVLDNDVQMEYFSLLRNGFNINVHNKKFFSFKEKKLNEYFLLWEK